MPDPESAPEIIPEIAPEIDKTIRSPRRRSRRLAGLSRRAAPLLMLFLAGCSLLVATPQPACPRVVLVDEARAVTLYRPGPGRDLTDVRYRGAISGFTSKCEYNLDEGLVDVDLDLKLVFTRGPAAHEGDGRFDYFVAITDDADKVIAKRVFTVTPEFPTGVTRVGVTEKLTQEISYRPAKSASGNKIFVGFQLTRDQLAEKRRQRQQQRQ